MVGMMHSFSARTVQSSGTVMVFSLDDEKLDVEVKPDIDFDVSLEVQRIHSLCTLQQPEQQLAEHVQEAKLDCRSANGTGDLWQLGVLLRSKYGYLVRQRTANLRRRARAYLRQLRHTYLVVTGLEGQEGGDILVDVNFKDHFALPHSRPWYDKLLSAVPQDWVGSAEGAAAVARVLAAGMRLVFLQLGTPLPPWRERRALLSKWLPEVFNDELIPLQPLPDQNAGIARMLAPYHRPLRAGPAAGCRQPGSSSNSGLPAARQDPQQQQSSAGSRPGSLPAAALAAARGVLGLGPFRATPSNQLLRGALAQTPQKVIIGFPEQQPVVYDAGVDGQPLCDTPIMHMADHAGLTSAGGTWGTAAVCSKLPGSQPIYTIPMAAAVADADATVELVEVMDHTVHNGGKAVMATTQLVGVAAAGLPGANSSRQLQRPPQQQYWQQLPLPQDGQRCLQQPAAAAARPEAASAQSQATKAGAPAAAAAAVSSTAAAKPGFKSLDQLLPRMRTVKLGARG